MLDVIGHIIMTIFDYFFAQNAPMTILMVVFGVSVVAYTRIREKSILIPMELYKYKKDLMKKQMDTAEPYLDQLHAKLYGLFRHERRVYLEQQGMTTSEARDHLDMDMPTFMHSLQLWGVHGVIRSEIRGFFQDNHLAGMTESDFRSYIERRKSGVWTSMVRAINEYWFGGMTAPSRSDIYDVHEKNKDEILRIIEEIFIEGRKLSIEAENKISATNLKRWKLAGNFF